MSTQRQVKLPWNFFHACICGNQPKCYKTDDTLYHIECHPCKISTPKLFDLQIAGMVFRYLVDTVKKDKATWQSLKLHDKFSQRT